MMYLREMLCSLFLALPHSALSPGRGELVFPFVHTLPTSCFLCSHWNILHSSPVLVQRASRQTTVTVKATAGNWSPGSKAPAHLAGKNIPGNFGFDPLSLGAPEGALSYYQQAELQHCRWAMMGVAGILIPDVLTHAGVLNVPDWTQAGKIYIEQVRHTVFFVALRSSRPSLLRLTQCFVFLQEGAYSFASLLMVQLFLHNVRCLEI